MAIKSPQRNGAIRSFIRKIRFRLATEVRAKNPLPCRSSVVPGSAIMVAAIDFVDAWIAARPF
jgi:hypothetical protein